MNPTPAPPDLTAFDAVTQLVTAAVYLTIGAAGLAQAPRDERTRVFAGLGAAHAVAFCIPAAAYFFGVKDWLAFDRIPLAITLSGLSLGALLMFHFSQVFPSRRPWIRASGLQMPIAYVLTPIAVFLLVRWWPGKPDEITAKFGLAFLVFGFPLMVLLGIILPVASIVSFLRSLRESVPGRAPEPGAPEPGVVAGPNPRPVIMGILLSQIAGGALALLILPPLHAVVPDSPAVTLVAVIVWMLGLLTPAAFAAGIWKYRVLEIAPERSAEVKPE